MLFREQVSAWGGRGVGAAKVTRNESFMFVSVSKCFTLHAADRVFKADNSRSRVTRNENSLDREWERDVCQSESGRRSLPGDELITMTISLFKNKEENFRCRASGSVQLKHEFFFYFHKVPIGCFMPGWRRTGRADSGIMWHAVGGVGRVISCFTYTWSLKIHSLIFLASSRCFY